MTGPNKAELGAMVEEATIDCHDEETHRSSGLVANCVRGRHKQAIHLLDLPMPEPPPKGAERIAAYRHWAR